MTPGVSHKNTQKHKAGATKRGVFLMARRGRAQQLGMGDGRPSVRRMRISLTRVSHDSALARAEVYLYAIWIRSEEAGVGSSSLPLGPDYDIH